MTTDFDYETIGQEDQEWDNKICELIRYAEDQGLNPDHVIGAWLGGVDY